MLRHFHIFGNVETKAAVAKLGALAQDTRLEVFRHLVTAGPAGLPAGRVGEKLGLPSATLSFHLAQLGHAGLVTSRRDGRSILYAADYGAIRALVEYLVENCCAADDACCVPFAASGADKPAGAARQRAKGRVRRGTDRDVG
jgi:DNA-binding transcriptional ArsR family regulator